MIRIVIAAPRNPDLSRPEFFDHLRNTHWPLVRDTRTVLPYLRHYTQNHVILPSGDLELPLPFPLFEGRDSVIELGFESMDALAEMSALPEYRDVIRPDEARFNDLPNIVATPCMPQFVFSGAQPGRLTRFDFLRRAPGVTLSEMTDALSQHGEALALDPLYRTLIDQRVHYLALGREERETASKDGWVAQIGFDAIVACRADHVDTLRLADKHFAPHLEGYVDMQASRSLIAANFLMHEAGNSTAAA